MALRSRNKVSANFNMSSMTDIVFLLLIFFMLTSTLVSPNALKLLLPNSKAKTLEKQTISIDPGLGVPLDVDIEGDGAVFLDNTGVMDLTYSFEIPIVGSQSVDCAIILSK